MRITIIKPNGDLKREVWEFELSVSFSGGCIYLKYYSFDSKETTRHKKWVSQTHWARLFGRDNTMEKPPIPSDVESDVRKKYQDFILTLPIKF